jgi:hypothetical protein
MGTVRNGAILFSVFSDQFSVGPHAGISRYSFAQYGFPHCLRTSRNNENVIKAIDSAFANPRFAR